MTCLSSLVSIVRVVSVMPYILVTTQIRLEAGPCIVGDERSDPELMKHLKAEQRRENGQFFKVWETMLLPREVMDSMEILGESRATDRKN